MDIGTVVILGFAMIVVIAALVILFWMQRSMKKSFKELDDKMEEIKEDPKSLSGRFADLTEETGPIAAQELADFGLDDTVIQMVDSLREKYSYKAGSKQDFDLLLAEGKARYSFFSNRIEPLENLEKAREMVRVLYGHEHTGKDGHALINVRTLERHLEIEEILYKEGVVAT